MNLHIQIGFSQKMFSFSVYCKLTRNGFLRIFSFYVLKMISIEKLRWKTTKLNELFNTRNDLLYCQLQSIYFGARKYTSSLQIDLNMKSYHNTTVKWKCISYIYQSWADDVMKSRENKEMHKLISEMVNMRCIQFGIIKLARVSRIDKSGIKLQIDFLSTCGERSVGNQIFVFFK